MGDIYLYELGAGPDIVLRDPTAAAGPGSDTTAPTFTGVLTSSVTSNSITVGWAGATSADNVAVARREYRIGGAGPYTAATADEESGKRHTFSGLTAGTQYQVDVRCVDTSGNASAPLTISAMTSPPATDGATTNYVRVTLATRTGEPHLNLDSVQWALFSQLSPASFGAPVAKGTKTMQQGSPLLEIALSPSAVPAGWYMLVLSAQDGTTSLACPVLVGA